MNLTFLSARDMNTTTLEIVFQDAVSAVGAMRVATKYPLEILCIEAPLWGMFTVLTLLSTWILFDQGLRSKSHRIMLFVTVVMYGASTVHWVLILLRTSSFPHELVHQRNLVASSSQRCLDALQNNTPCDLFAFITTSNANELSSCAPTSLITLNMILSDSVVVWRAWILWSRNRVIQTLSVMLVLTTLGVSLADVSSACTTFQGSMFEGLPVGLVALSMSLATNVWATTLIACKAWGHRRLIREHIQSGSGKTQVEKMMALLVESGAIYCCIWIILVAFNASALEGRAVLGPNRRPNSPGQNFVTDIKKFIEGGMFQVIGIYPTLIVVLVCLHKTHCDRNFTYKIPHAPQIALHDIRVTVDTETTAADSRGMVYVLDREECYGADCRQGDVRREGDGESVVVMDIKRMDVKEEEKV